jgi:catechol 2,3-dioxygenase-like lactoylglutathione lyase family enzyme
MIDFDGSGMPTIEWGEIFHVGLRVMDIAAAQADLTSSMNLHWTPTLSIPMTAWVPGEGQKEYVMDMSHSMEGPVHLELLSGPPGSVWDASEYPGLHHIGVWVDDVKGVNEELVKAGWNVEMAGLSPEEGYGGFTYVRSPAGILFEPESCLGGGKERFARWWGGSDLF